MDETGRVPLDELMTHREWVGRIARALLSGAAADDLEQRVWLSALTNPPRHAGSLRGWLGTLLRRGARDRWREDARRRRREHRAARPESEPSTVDLVARAETHRLVVNAIMSLPEPYRETVLMRWYEDLGPTAIADRTGTPVETVKTRLKRAHARLAEILDEAHGKDGKRWLGALVPLAGSGVAATGVTTKLAVGLTAAGLLLLAGAIQLLPARSTGSPPVEPRPPDAEALASEAESGPEPAPPTLDLVAPPTEILAAEEPAPPVVPDEAASQAPEGLVVFAVDTAGRPVSEARITVLRRPDHAARTGDGALGRATRNRPPVEPIAKGVTGEDGRVAIPGIPPGSCWMSAQAKALAGVSGNFGIVEGLTPDPMRIVLVPTTTLRGKVRRIGGEIVTGATVVLGNEFPLAASRSEVDEHGWYEFPDVMAGRRTLGVRLPSGAVIGVTELTLPRVGVYDILLDLGGILTGRVTDAATGRPIAGARVSAALGRRHADEAYGHVVGTTGSDGSYRIEDLPGDRLTAIEVEARGYVRSQAWYSRKAPFTRERPLVTDFALERGATVRGRVLREDGTPVIGCDVFADHRDRQAPSWHVTGTDGQGRYEIRHVRRGPVTLRAVEPGYWQRGYDDILSAGWSSTDAAIVIPLSGEVVKDITLVPGGVVEGRVLDRTGAPVPGAGVTIGPGGRSSMDVTALDGTFRLVGICPGEGKRVFGYRRRTSRFLWGVRSESAPFTLPPDAPVRGIEVVLRGGATVSGRIVDREGRPVPGVQLRAGGLASDRTSDPAEAALRSTHRHPVNVDGSFRIEEVPPGRLALAASARGFGPAMLTDVVIEDGEDRDDLELIMDRSRRFLGRVVDGDGRGVAGAAIRYRFQPRRRLHRGSGPGSTGPIRALSDHAGRFELDEVGRGRYVVSAGRADLRTVHAVLEEDADEILLTLDAGLSIRGVVLDAATGKPIPDVTVFATPMWAALDVPTDDARTRTGKNGRYELTGLRPGWHRVQAGVEVRPEDPNYYVPSTRIQKDRARAGAKNHVIRLYPGTVTTGRVTDARGRPLRGIAVSVRASRNERIRTDHDGRFRITRIPPGVVDITFDDPESRSRQREGFCVARLRRVRAGTRDLEVVLKRGLAIAGRIVGPDGRAPTSMGRVTVSSGKYDSHAVRIRADGTFTTRPLDPSKTWTLSLKQFPHHDLLRRGKLRAGMENVLICLGEALTISGRVLDENGQPAAGVKVWALPHRDRSGRREREAVSDQDGRFVIEGLGDTEYRVSAGRSNDWESRKSVTVRAGAKGLELCSRKLCRITGTLVDERGKPARGGVSYHQKYPGGGSRKNGGRRIGEDGRFTLISLRPGPVEITWAKANGEKQTAEFTAPAKDIILVAK